MLCRNLGMFVHAVVAVDGSKFKAVNNRDRNHTTSKVAKRIELVEASIERYLATLDRADRENSDMPEERTEIAGLRRPMQSLKEMEHRVEAAPDGQVSLTRSGRAFDGDKRARYRHRRL
jgi:hypothetical protein